MAHRGAARVILVAAVLAIAGGLTGTSFAYELAVIPSRLDLSVKPGKKIEGAIMVTGTFDQPTKIRAMVGDWTMGPHGEVVLLGPGRQPRSLGRWLWVTPVEFLLSRGRKQLVRFQMQVPSDITGSYWGVLLFETMPLGQIKDDAVGMRTAARLATVLYASTERGAVLDARVSGVSAAYQSGKVVFQAGFDNLGNLIARVRGRFDLKDQRTGKIAATVPIAPRTIIPGVTCRLAADWRGKLTPGDYVPSLYIDYGREENRTGQVLKVASSPS